MDTRTLEVRGLGEGEKPRATEVLVAAEAEAMDRAERRALLARMAEEPATAAETREAMQAALRSKGTNAQRRRARRQMEQAGRRASRKGRHA